jgi:ATP-dependent RNA helicase DDX10/DBP4
VRTKLDRLFERTNQGVLSAHYRALVDHAGDGLGGGDDGDDFLTLARADHRLSDDSSDDDDHAADAGEQDKGKGPAKADAENVSKRRLKLGATRKGAASLRPAPQHVRFGDDGAAHDAFGIHAPDAAADAAAAARGARHAEEQRGRVAAADVRDREDARTRKQEKKRKRREREREVRPPPHPCFTPS